MLGGLLAERIRMLITVMLPRSLVISRCFYDVTPLNIKKHDNNLDWKLEGRQDFSLVVAGSVMG